MIAGPCLTLAAMVNGVGHCSDRDVNRFEHLGLQTQPGSRVAAPLVVS